MIALDPSPEQKRGSAVTDQPARTPDDWAEVLRYSDVIRAGDMLYLSGQVGLDDNGVPQADPAAQFRAAFAKIAEVLATVGATPEDVVDLTSFHVDYPSNMEAFFAAKNEFQGAGRPAWTAVGVASLAMPATLVEIKAVAYKPA